MTENHPAGLDQRIYDGIRLLAHLDPDRASTRNGAGFNSSDGAWGHAIAEKPFAQWSLKMGQMAYKLLRKYAGQLAAAGIVYEDILDPSALPPEAGKKTQTARIALVAVGTGRALHFTSRQDDPLLDSVRALPQRRWTGAPDYAWAIPLVPANIPGLRALYKAGVAFDDASVRALKSLSTASTEPRTRPAPAQEAEPTPAATRAPGASGTRAEDRGMVRVAYLVDAQNEVVYGLKSLPANRVLPGYVYRTPQEAQTAADAMNALLLDRIELS